MLPPGDKSPTMDGDPKYKEEITQDFDEVFQNFNGEEQDDETDTRYDKMGDKRRTWVQSKIGPDQRVSDATTASP